MTDTPSKLYLFTLHYPGDPESKSNRAAPSVEAAVAKWGGEFVPRKDGICRSSHDPSELGFCGLLRFAPSMFREMDDVDRELAGSLPGVVVRTEGGLNLLAERGETVELVVRRQDLLF